MKQPQYQPMSVAEMALSLFAVNEGHLDEVEVTKAVAFESALQAFAKSSHAEALAAINANPEYTDDTAAKLKAIVEDFKANGSW